MMDTIRAGWKTALRQPFAVISLFVYELLWGFVLYRFVQSVVTPLMHRYPGPAISPSGTYLFLAESQFRIVKTNLIYPYLWWLLGLLALRMIVSPLLNAAVYFSIHHREMHAGYRFFKGIKQLTPSYMLYYFLQCLIIAAPLFWLANKAVDMFSKYHSYGSYLLGILPYLLGYLAYSRLIQLAFVYLQFGKVSHIRLLTTALCFVTNLLRIVWVSLILLLLTLLVTVLTLTASYLWAGLTALILYQLYPLARMFFKVWDIATQYELWRSRVNA